MKQLYLFEPLEPADPSTLARTTDPDTSHEAAQSLRALRLTETRAEILATLRRHPKGLTDEFIADFYRGPKVSPSGLRTRRAELVDAGLVVDSGCRDVTASGRQAIVWVLA